MTRGPLRAVPLLAALVLVHAPAALAGTGKRVFAHAAGYTAGSAYCNNFSIIGDYQPPDATMPFIGDTWLVFGCGDAESVTGGPWGLTVKVTIKTPGSYVGYSAPTLYHGDTMAQAVGAGPSSGAVFRNGNWYYEWINSNATNASGYGTQVSSCGIKVDVEIVLEVGVKPNGQPNNSVLGTAKDVVGGCSQSGAVVEGSAPQIETARHDYRTAIKDLQEAAKARDKAQAVQRIAAAKRETVKAKSVGEEVFGSIDPSTLKLIERDNERALADDGHMEMTVEEDQTFNPSSYAPELTNDESKLRAAEQVM